MQCSSLTLFCLRTHWGGERIWALENLSSGPSVSHPATVHWGALLIRCLQLDASAVPFWGHWMCRQVCVRARATGAKPSASVRQARGRSLTSECSKVRTVVAPWWPLMLSKILSLRGGGWKWLQILYDHRKSWSIKWTCQEPISNTTAGLLIFHIHLLQYPVLITIFKKNLERQKKFYTENKRAVAGVGTAVLGFSTISCFAFNFGKNNLGWGRKKTRDVSDSNIQGDRTALDYKLK